jgi:hypothetical protein
MILLHALSRYTSTSDLLEQGCERRKGPYIILLLITISVGSRRIVVSVKFGGASGASFPEARMLGPVLVTPYLVLAAIP